MTIKYEDFYLGVICALAALEPHNADTLYDEIVRTVDEDRLVEIARKHGHMRWSGLSKYLKRNGSDKRES